MKKLSLFAIVMIMVMVACNKEQDTFKESKDANSEYADKSLFVKQFDASGEFSSKIAVNGCQGLVSLSNRGSGGSFSIGAFILSGQQCWGSCDVNSPVLSSITNGEFTLTDSEGDQLFITYSDGCYENGIDCISPNGESACQAYTGYYVVSGGTGQYNNVGGEGTLVITQFINGLDLTKSSEEPVAAQANNMSAFEMDGLLTFPYFIEGDEYER